MNAFDQPTILLSRRAFVRGGSLFLLAADAGRLLADDGPTTPQVRMGLLTDLHYADKPPRGTRHYRQTLKKLSEATERLGNERLDGVVELGDLIDTAGSVTADLSHLKRINQRYASLPFPRHYVLGNHCVEMLTKREFLDGVERDRPHHSFDAGGTHFVVLDACFRHDGQPYGRKNFEWFDANIPADQIEWLQADLEATHHKTIVFTHQRLDVANRYAVKNAAAVRRALERSGKVLAVFQGHHHRNDHREISGLHYCTLAAMVEGPGEQDNAYSILEAFADGTLRLTGFRKQSSYRWT